MTLAERNETVLRANERRLYAWFLLLVAIWSSLYAGWYRWDTATGETNQEALISRVKSR